MDNFVEIDVKYKRFGFTRKRRQGMLFDLYAWFLLWQHFGWDFSMIGKKPMDELQSGMLYTGALSYDRFKGEKHEFTVEDMERWMNDLPVSKMKEISRALMESTKILEPLAKAGAAVEKKK